MSQPLRIAIVGAGTGGLTLARTLLHRNARASVKVFEQWDSVKARGGSISMMQGASVLDRVGLRDEFLAKATTLDAVKVFSNGKELLSIENTNFEAHHVMRQDLQQLLFDSIPGTVELGKTLDSAEEHDDGVDLTFTDGTKEDADVLVGADGMHSIVAEKCFDSPVEPVWTGYRILLAVSDRAVLTQPSTLIIRWCTDKNGTPYYQMVHPAGGPHRRDIGCIVSQADQPVSAEWDSCSLGQEMLEIALESDPNFTPMTDIIESAERIYNWGVFHIPVRPNWISEKGRIVLLGDAAHAMSPFQGQGANMAMQDGYCLGRLLAECSQGAVTLPEALADYQCIRKAPCEAMVKRSANAAKLHFLTGWKASARDTLLQVAGRAIVPRVAQNAKPWDRHQELEI